MDSRHLRNFVIIAHIDHGKSTLADRLLELTGTIEHRKMREQFLDQMELERERGITIKMQPVRMQYITGGQSYTLNLIDTPGHVDFSYEVSRSLAAVEGAILLVDATQGIQAQTVQNFRFAEEARLTIIPAVNKIDLPSADVERTVAELASLLGIDPSRVHTISAKQGTGVRELLDDVVSRVPPPQSEGKNELRALIFDSLYDSYQGVIAHIRVVDGEVRSHDVIRFFASGEKSEVIEVGVLSPDRIPVASLGPGEIGYLATGIKTPDAVRVGDTITKETRNKKQETTRLPDGQGTSSFAGRGGNPWPSAEGEQRARQESGNMIRPLLGYREPSPVVFASIFPENQDDYSVLRESLGKLKLNDASLFFEPLPNAGALGRGYRVGFLGMLHMEIVAERLRREYGLRLVFSNPSVAFRVKLRGGGEEIIFAASNMPHSHDYEALEERWANAEVITPPHYLGTLATLVNDRGGLIRETITITGERLLVHFEAPLRELIVDFFDTLKSATQGYASMVYTLGEWKAASLTRLDIFIAGEEVDAFAEIVPQEKVYTIARERLKKLKALLPRELFSISLQAKAEGRIIASESISALKKDVTGYLYGGDRTRKMKLWKKQQRGKKRLGEIGRVRIPSSVFLAMLKRAE